jgi:hypothetical protein
VIRWACSVASSARMALSRGPGRKMRVQGLSIVARSNWRPNARFGVRVEGRRRRAVPDTLGAPEIPGSPRGLLLRTVLLITLTPWKNDSASSWSSLRKADPSATEAATLTYTKLG